MIVLGLSGGHDANFCVVRDGEVLGAWEKERFTRRRHDFGDVTPYLGGALTWLGLTPDDIDLVATSEPIRAGLGPGHTVLRGDRYDRPDAWTHQRVEVLGRRYPAVSIPHHLAHAAYARYLSPAPSTAVITWDAGGDVGSGASCSTTVSSWTGPRLDSLERIEGANLGSLWYLYAHAVFGDEHTAGKLMGLSARGTDSLDEAFGAAFVASAPSSFGAVPIVRVTRAQFSSPPHAEGARGWHRPRAGDVAHAVQQVTTTTGLALARRVQEATGTRHLALAGGVALNGYLNEAIRRDAGFDDVFVPPAVDDGGLSVGCALFASHHVAEVPWPGAAFPREFLGYAHDDLAVSGHGAGDALDQRIGRLGLTVKPVDAPEAEQLAIDALVQGETIAWFEGRAEHGPRALGHRSILSLADHPDRRDHLNRIKGREPFRPVAPVVLEEDLVRWFAGAGPSPWMMFIVPGTDVAARDIPAAIHDDGTARVQTVTPATALGRLVAGVRQATGIGCVINTSFNIGAPIVESPDDAVTTFAGSGLDRLFLPGRLVLA